MTLVTTGSPVIPPSRVHDLDAVVVGAGGAGLYAALELKQELGPEARIGVISKLYPSRSHTGAAQGGVCAALGNTEEDHWEWHWFDTVKGGDYLVDQDAAEVMCRDAVETIINLEHLGLPFDRTPEGLINQRRFGGHTRNYGEGPVRRSCFAADRTGHAILQTLFQQCIRREVAFFDEYQVLDLVLPEGPGGPVSGVIALQLATSELHAFRAKAVLFATGGYGKVFKVTSNAHTLTGDGMAIPYRRGLPLEDMEFFQFHPTGMYKLGFLLSEAMRGEGGFLVNDAGERFMERYAPTMKDLASRDVVSPLHLPGGRRGAGDRRQGLRPSRRAPPRRRGARQEAPRHERLHPDLLRARAADRSRADPADRPLRDGRRPDRHRRPRPGRRRRHGDPRAVRRGRGGLRIGPRREPARDELAARHPRLRAARREADGRRPGRAAGARRRPRGGGIGPGAGLRPAGRATTASGRPSSAPSSRR